MTASKKQSKLGRFLPFLFILFVKPIRSLYWSNVHRQDHRSGCLLNWHFILIIRYSLSGIVFRSIPASEPPRAFRNGQLSCDRKFYSQGQPKQPHTKLAPGSPKVVSPPAFSIVPRLEAWNKVLYSHVFMLRVVTLLSEGGQGYFREKDLCWGSSLTLHALSRARCTKCTPHSRITVRIRASVVVEIASF